MEITDRMILTITILGLALVLTFTPDCLHDITAVDRDSVGDRFCGQIRPTDLNTRGNVTFIDVAVEDAPQIIAFTDHGMKVNRSYTVHGSITMYHGRLEITIERARPVHEG